jgi:hypothetical protein
VSSLIFYTDKTQALIATDTLATSATVPGTPFKFTTKAFIVPHLRMIIAGTGCGGFCDRWFLQINDRMVVRGIGNLNDHTPRNLALLWSSHKEEFPILENATSTIYHFGFSEEDQLMRSYAYRSTSNFESEQLPYCLGGKPDYSAPNPYELPKDFKTIMESQRELQSSETKENRVYIGGEIQVIHLTKDGFSSYPLCKFDDYDSDESAIYSNYGKA